MKLHLILSILLSVIFLAGAALGGWWLISHRREPAERAVRKVVPKVLAPAIEAKLNQSVTVVEYGSARPKIQLEITSQVSGLVVEKAGNFLSGKYVNKGQVLCRIEETDYEIAVERVEKTIELLNTQLDRLAQEAENLAESQRIETERRDLAQSQVEKVSRLLERNAASDNELDLARETLLGRDAQVQNIANQLALIPPQRAQLEAEIGSAQVELRQAQTNLARCVIRSPVTGRVLNCDVEVGEQVLAGTKCGQIYGTDVMEVPVSIGYSELEWIDTGLLDVGEDQGSDELSGYIEAIVEWERPDNGQTVSWRGRIDRIEAGLEAETRMAGLVIRVENPRLNEAKPILEINMFCKVTVLGKKLPEVYIVPRRAILPDEDVYVVFEGKLAKRAVKVARFASEEAMILPGGGISQGDQVVISSIGKPVLGMSVEAVGELISGGNNNP